jgi:hypothetical protein
MLTGKLTHAKAGWGLSLLLGLFSQAATATDVVVAYGDEAARQARAVQAAYEADRLEFIKAVDRDIKLNFDRELDRLRSPVTQLAALAIIRQG